VSATILSDVNCKSEWVTLNNTVARDDTPHRTASTLVECQAACEFDPRCVSVDWSSNNRLCELNTDPSHRHGTPDDSSSKNHYELVSRCNITQGQCFQCNVVADINTPISNFKSKSKFIKSRRTKVVTNTAITVTKHDTLQ